MRDWNEWTTVEVRVLRDLYPSGGATACAPHLPGRNLAAIRQHARRLGLRRYFAWTDDELSLLRASRPLMSIQECSRLFPHRSISAVRCRAVELGLTRSAA